MPILLFRVDDRLIHGQVVVGWGAQLGFRKIAVIDDTLAASAWEQDLYRAGLPDSLEALFLTVDQARSAIPDLAAARAPAIALTRDIRTMRRLAEGGVLDGFEVNLGGLHAAPGRQRILPYLFLSDEDREELGRLSRADVSVTAQDVPGARRISLTELLS